MPRSGTSGQTGRADRIPRSTSTSAGNHSERSECHHPTARNPHQDHPAESRFKKTRRPLDNNSKEDSICMLVVIGVQVDEGRTEGSIWPARRG